MGQERLALYTTIHPKSLRFVPEWFRSVRAQTDRGFDLWVGLDLVSPDDAVEAFGENPKPVWVQCRPGAMPTEIRMEAIRRIVVDYAGVVFVDSDDLLEPDRVAWARRSLADLDVVGCAMRLVNERGCDLGVTFRWPEASKGWDDLVRLNAFGLGNTAYRSSVLRRCLPIPHECEMEDWFLITRAWIQGAVIGFDPKCGMAYRQHSANMTAVLPPYTPQQVLDSADSVLRHYSYVLKSIPEIGPPHRRAFERAQQGVRAFLAAIHASQQVLQFYVAGLNRLQRAHLWFDCVAHPALDEIWITGS